MQDKPLSHKIALVTGASRGVGRGIAIELGVAGATVYVTGRSSGEDRTEGLLGTIEETAAAVTAAGGRGIALRCDHTNDAEVEAVFARLKEEEGRLDLLVNNVWGGYEQHDGFDKPFWEQSLTRWNGMFRAGLRAHFTASQLAAPMMIARRRGLIINISFETTSFLWNTMYDTAKAAVNRLAFGMAQELRKYQVAAVAVYPGYVKTERVVATIEQTGQTEDWTQTQTPHYAGRAIVALATDPQIMTKTGEGFHVGDLAKLYGFTDIDGRQLGAFIIPPYETAH